MTLQEVQACSSQNLAQTYFSLGLSIPHSTMITEDGYQACLGEFDHPICNFATKLNLAPWSANKLAALASSRRAFSVYALPGDGPKHLAEILTRVGFQVSYRLSQLVVESGSQCDSDFMTIAEEPGRRLEVARFMTDQFFARQTEVFKRRVAQATADARGLELYEYFEKSARTGAVMICQSPGAVGVYNLCVAPGSRGRGIGKSITRWALGRSRAAGKLTTLQCDARLQSWYEGQGFGCTGSVEVYSLSKAGRSDIMNTS